jgi:hypothetical protein
MDIKRTIRQFFFNHTRVKIFSLLSSFFLWFYITLGNQFEDVLNVDLVVINKPVNKILVYPIPKSIPVLCRGSGSTLFGQKLTHDMYIQIDLDEYPSDTELPVRIEMIRHHDTELKLTPVRIESEQPIKIAYDDLMIKKVPVISDIEFKPKEGYTQVGEVVLTPDSVVLTGPKKEVRTYESIHTKSQVFYVLRPIEGMIDLVDSTSNLVDLSHHHVQFYADIQGIGERLFTEIPVRVINAPSGIKVSSVPSMLSIRLHGGVEVLKKLTRNDIEVTIDYRRRQQYGRQIPAMIHVPANVSFTDVKPKQFELLIER